MLDEQAGEGGDDMATSEFKTSFLAAAGGTYAVGRRRCYVARSVHYAEGRYVLGDRENVRICGYSTLISYGIAI
jgi:hypothetical protein